VNLRRSAAPSLRSGTPRPEAGRGRRLGLAGLLLASLLLLASFGLAACAREPAAEAEDSTPGVTLVRLDGDVDVGSQALISRAIRAAKSAGDATLLIDLDTLGGELDVLWAMQKQIDEAEKDGVATVTWVHDRAISAGALLALCSKRVYMSSSGTIGASAPVVAGPRGMEEPDEGVREKIVSYLRAQVTAMAERRGRPPALAIAMVDRNMGVRQVKIDGEVRMITGDEWDSLRESGTPVELQKTIVPRGELLTLTARPAVELGIADGIADELKVVLEKLGIPDARVGDALTRSNSEKVVTWLTRLTPLLLLAGLVLGYLELKMPGFGLPGILSIVCFVLLLVGQYLAGLADIPHIVAVAVGAALVAVEVFVLPGTLWLGIGGLLLIVGGLVLGSVGPGFDFGNAFDQRLVLDAAFRIIGSAVVALIVVMVLSRFLPKTPVLRRIVLAPSADVAAFGGAMPESGAIGALPGGLLAGAVGELGRVVTDLRPVGKVELDAHKGYEYEARSVGAVLPRGERVRVVEVSAARLVVEPAPEPAGGSSPA
jgi:membrane-bound serine protease (ClpP class)